MIKLSNANLAYLPASVETPQYDRSDLKSGVVHIGVGNFPRAHQYYYHNNYLNGSKADPARKNWAITSVGLRDTPSEAKRSRIMREQDGLYTLTEYPTKGQPKVSVIGSSRKYLNVQSEPQTVLDEMSGRDTHIVSVIVTEGGYNVDEAGRFKIENPDVQHDLAALKALQPDAVIQPGALKTVFGIVTEALNRRHAADLPPFTVMSCDNLRHNGDITRTAILGFAQAYKPELARWIDTQGAFPNSMVDRIVPATKDSDAVRLNKLSGVADGSPVFCEDFTQWVIEDKFCDGRPEFASFGIQLTGNVAGYEQTKLRMLNASHLMLCYPSLLLGYRKVDEAMGDQHLVSLLDGFMEHDVIPLQTPPDDLDLHEYKNNLLTRFSNPNLGDQLQRLLLDSASKLPVFVQDTLRTTLAQGREPKRLAFMLACYVRCLSGVDDQHNKFVVEEPKLTAEDRELARATGASPLHMSPFQGWGLADHPEFVSAFLHYRSEIVVRGVKPVLAELIRDEHASG